MSKARELYEDLSREFTRRGVGSSDFSKLENLYHLASDNEKLQPQWRKLQQKTINELTDEDGYRTRLLHVIVDELAYLWKDLNPNLSRLPDNYATMDELLEKIRKDRQLPSTTTMLQQGNNNE